MRTARFAGAMIVAAALVFELGAEWSRAAGQEIPRREVVEIAPAMNDADEAVLGRPVAFAAGGDRLYIADALDCAIKVFSRDGRFISSFGRKGGGPGELSFPSGVAVDGDAIIVADKLNLRIQVFDGQGRARGGFKLPYPPDRVFALGAGRLLVTANPTGRRAGERLLHIHGADGRLAWEGLEARTSSDAAFDAIRNMIVVCPGRDGDFFVVYRIEERAIRHFSASGALLREFAVDERHAFRTMNAPAARGSTRLAGFCWAASQDGGFLYLSAPETVGGMDLGPGRTVSVVDREGRLRSVLVLPYPVHRFLVADGRLFGIDDEGALRIFEVGP